MCAASGICIFKMYIIHMNGAAPFTRRPSTSHLKPLASPIPHSCTRPTTRPSFRLTNVQFDAAYFISLSPNAGQLINLKPGKHSRHHPHLPRLHFPPLVFFFFPVPKPPPPFHTHTHTHPSPPLLQSLLWRRRSLHCAGGLKHCV